ncbi:sensor histidine kinase [Spongiivirga citrea]|uniref:histidine kinase n=1 Tax=Spongiivirga citrea TaxID=1481457 RepID=A0A6M0CM94_9FLAO|nr:ATP-binding protein [Spongiivirga citrea]NER16949.1 sensor histidine kinase [Spongiivirga citrea]
MARELKTSYRFAVRASSLIAVVLTVIFVALQFFLFDISWWASLAFPILVLAICFTVIQYGVQRFIYRRIKQIYDDLTLLESTSFEKQPITNDMKTLTKDIEEFARNKKLEVETLKIKENYRKEFMGNVSHELKTPLFTVQGYLLTVLDGEMDAALQKKYLQRASKGVERLVYIVSDLDMITKLEMGNLNLEYEDFDIVDLVQNVFDLLEMKASKKDITLMFDMDYEEPILVHADKERIQQVVTNLIVNSIKYGTKGGTTEVSIENLIMNKVIIRITDNGEGISGSHLPRIFERFYRVDKSGSRKEGGSGLGLSIVKHIIEAHDERIYVESDYGVGSEFSFTLEKTK